MRRWDQSPPEGEDTIRVPDFPDDRARMIYRCRMHMEAPHVGAKSRLVAREDAADLYPPIRQSEWDDAYLMANIRWAAYAQACRNHKPPKPPPDPLYAAMIEHPPVPSYRDVVHGPQPGEPAYVIPRGEGLVRVRQLLAPFYAKAGLRAAQRGGG